MGEPETTAQQTTDAQCVVQVVPFCDRNVPERLHRALNASARRLFVAVEPLTDYYAEALATGAVAAIESGTFRLAPSGSLLLRDSDDGSRGVVVAERQGDGWVLTGGAAS